MIKYSTVNLERDDIRVIIIREHNETLVGFNFHFGVDDKESDEDYKIPSKELWALYETLIKREMIFKKYCFTDKQIEAAEFWQSEEAELPRMLKCIAIYLEKIMNHGESLPKFRNEDDLKLELPYE